MIIRDQAGRTQVVTPESLGGHVNPNGTVTLKDATGAEKTLPKTGDKQSVLGYLGMMLISVLGYAVKKKYRTNHMTWECHKNNLEER